MVSPPGSGCNSINSFGIPRSKACEAASKQLALAGVSVLRNQLGMANLSQSRAIVLLSGGMDSAVCAALAARDYEAAAVHVDYGQRTGSQERQSLHVIWDRLWIKHRLLVANPVFRAIGVSA